MLSIRSILHPTDFSEPSRSAFRLACSLARDSGAHLVALHVIPPPVMFTGEGVLLPPPPAQDWDGMQERLQQLTSLDPKVHLEHRLAQGDASSEILRAAMELQCDLIVMGTHGRTGLGRLLMGSVAEQVLRRAPCPVLTVKTPPSSAAPNAEAVEAMAAT